MALATAEHASWGHWMTYLFSKSTKNPDGSATIPPELVERWMRQALTPYAELSDSEKDSDLVEVAKILPAIDKYVAEEVRFAIDLQDLPF